MVSIIQVRLYQSSIINSKVFSIIIAIINSEASSNSIYSFDSYSASVGFGFDNSEAFGGGCFNSFEDSVAQL